MPPQADTARPLRRNALANIAGRVLSAAVWIAVTPYVLGRLGPERFGVWSLFFMLGGYAATFDLGMSGGVGRFLPVAVARDDRQGAARIIYRSLWMSASLGLLTMLLCIAGRGLFIQVFHVPDRWALEVRDSLSVFAVSLFVFSVALVLQGALMGFQRLDLWNLYFMAGLVLHAIVLVSGLGLGWGLMAPALAALSGNVVVVALAWRSVRRGLAALGTATGASSVRWRELLGFGAVVQASNAVGVGQLQAGKLMLGVLGQLVWVTQFELGFRVANALWGLPVLIQGAVAPAAARALEVGGRPKVLEIYEWCCRWVFAVTGWVLGSLWLLAPPLFRLWLGNPSPETVATARWLAVAFATATLAGPALPVSRGHGWPGLEVLNFGVALGLNVLLGLWLIPGRGAEGAAIAMAFSFAVAAACMLSVFHRRLGVSSRWWAGRLAAPRLLPAVGAVVALWLLLSRWRVDSRAEALAAVMVGGLLFTALLVLLTWPTGDPQAVWMLGRGWLDRLTGRTEAAKQSR